MRKTKIVVTIGPSTSSYEMIKELIIKGVNVFRLNFSHADHKIHANSIKMIRKASKELSKDAAILQDISGPKVRIGKIDGILSFQKDEEIFLSKHEDDNPKVLDLSYPEIIDMVKVDDEILFSDGTIKSIVVEKKDDLLRLKLLNDGELTSFKGVNFPTTKLSISAITKKDELDLKFGAKEGVDIVALSFVQNEDDVLKARAIMKNLNFEPMVISKIETGESIKNLDKILKVSDGVMVARGDLGAEFGLTKLPRIQKHIILSANKANKPSITATQMLTSMKEHPYPTRAEVSDIANAVYDGTDAVMLSDETTIGKFPIQAVEVLHDTIKDVEKDYPYYKDFKPENSSDSVSKAAVQIASNLTNASLVVFTESGYSAKSISKYRPKEKIYAISHSLKTHRELSLLWGVYPIFVMENIHNPTKLLYDFVIKIKKEKKLSDDSKFVITMGSVSGVKYTTNLIRVLDKDGMDAVLDYNF